MKQFTVERINALLAELHEFNSIPLNEMELTENGKPISFNAKLLDDWRFIGLSNQNFVRFRMWEQEASFRFEC